MKIVLVVALVAFPAFAEAPVGFGGYKGTFVIKKSGASRPHVLNEELAKKRLAPCSTFKIPHTVFALEAGVAENERYHQKYNPATHPSKSWWPDTWAKDHTLESAIRNSVVWFYQNISKQIGAEKMAGLLRKANYGNADISGGQETFWLSSSLKISPLEQVNFLEQLFENRLPFQARSVEIVKKITIEEDGEGYTLHGKTGTCRLSEGGYGAWWIGAVRSRAGATHYFALYIEGDDFSSINSDRKIIGRQMLQKQGAL